jgi:hypothetical protein
MSVLPDTTTDKKRGTRRRSGPLLAAACSAALLLAAVALSLGRGDFTPGEELGSAGVEDIVVSPKATSYPQTDALRLDEGHKVVYVYLRVEDLAAERGLEARVERSSRTSALARLFGGGGIRVVDEEENRLGASEGRVSGVVRFAVRAGSGGPLPAGDYTVEVFAGGVPVAEKYFVVADQQA